jgi:hypothetical protein
MSGFAFIRVGGLVSCAPMRQDKLRMVTVATSGDLAEEQSQWFPELSN